jgi:hypothetical protein
VALLTSKKVLGTVVSDPAVQALHSIKNSNDPAADLRANLKAQVVENSHVIRISAIMSRSEQASTIVQAVIRAYFLAREE